MEKVRKAAGFLSVRLPAACETAVVLGSGLGTFGDLLENKTEISYTEIPYFPTSSVVGHAGKLIFGYLNGKPLICMSGRCHFYEGYSMQEICFYVRVLRVFGVKNLIVTNAAGGINLSFKPGDLMMISDHIKFFDDSPLRGENYDELGPRFNDMSTCYTPALAEIARLAATENGITLREGVYAYMPGPSFETCAEIRALRTLGADAVGMSTVPEVITASHCALNVLGISCITNMAAGILPQPLSHEEVFQTANLTSEKFKRLVSDIINKI